MVVLVVLCLGVLFFVPRLFEEKRRDIVFGFPSFRPFLIQILLKLYRCLDDALKICMCFGYNPQVNF